MHKIEIVNWIFHNTNLLSAEAGNQTQSVFICWDTVSAHKTYWTWRYKTISYFQLYDSNYYDWMWYNHSLMDVFHQWKRCEIVVVFIETKRAFGDRYVICVYVGRILCKKILHDMQAICFLEHRSFLYQYVS